MEVKSIIVFKGWLKGMQKIAFQLLLKEKGGISLKEAQYIKTKILDNEVVELGVADNQVAREIIAKARELNVVCDLK